MPDDDVIVFESQDALMLRAVGKALDAARIPHEVRFDRPALPQYGPNKPPRRVVVAADVAPRAREVVDAAAARRQRMVDVEAQSRRYRRYASPTRDGSGGGDAGVSFLGDSGPSCGDGGGSDGGGCGGD